MCYAKSRSRWSKLTNFSILVEKCFVAFFEMLFFLLLISFCKKRDFGYFHHFFNYFYLNDKLKFSRQTKSPRDSAICTKPSSSSLLKLIRKNWLNFFVKIFNFENYFFGLLSLMEKIKRKLTQKTKISWLTAIAGWSIFLENLQIYS